MVQIPPFQNQQLFQLALTHRSYLNEHPEITENNERLEFLGDAILGFVVGDLLFNRYPELNEAQLTRLRSRLVDEPQLAKFATQLGLGNLMYLGQGAIKEGGRQNPSLLSDTFEAMIGAYFLDAGIESVQKFVRSLFQNAIDNLIIPESRQVSEKIIDVKNRLQQWALANFQEVPEYFLIQESGPDHAKEFIFGVKIKGKLYAEGKGSRKREATKMAAENALKQVINDKKKISF